MRRRPPRARASALALVVLAFALAGCGGGGDDGGGGDGGGDAAFDAGPVEVADPGSTRPVGERAFVQYTGSGPNFEPNTKTTLGVTVREVNEGDASDIEGLGESVVPYYVLVEYENHGDAEVQVGVIGTGFTIRGSDGEEYDTEGVVEISGEFEACPDAEPNSTLPASEAIADCVMIPVSEGVQPEQVRFQGDIVAAPEPIAWTVE